MYLLSTLYRTFPAVLVKEESQKGDPFMLVPLYFFMSETRGHSLQVQEWSRQDGAVIR